MSLFGNPFPISGFLTLNYKDDSPKDKILSLNIYISLLRGDHEMMKNEIGKIRLNLLKKKTIHNPLFMDVTVQSQNQSSVSLDSYPYFDLM